MCTSLGGVDAANAKGMRLNEAAWTSQGPITSPGKHRVQEEGEGPHIRGRDSDSATKQACDRISWASQALGSFAGNCILAPAVALVPCTVPAAWITLGDKRGVLWMKKAVWVAL